MLSDDLLPVILVGGGRGIGAAILDELLGRERYRILVVGRTAPRQVCEACQFRAVDLSDFNQTCGLIDEICKSEWNEPAALICNAGIGYFDAVEKIDPRDWQRVLNVNLTAPFLFIRAFIGAMKRKNSGRIVAISSDADHLGFPQAAAYCASKFGLLGVAEAVRKELVGFNVSITTISPGRVDTYFNGKAPGDRPKALRPQHVAAQVLQVIEQPATCQIESIRLRSTLE